MGLSGPFIPAAGPLFVPSAAWILQKGIPRNLASDLPPFFLLLDLFLCRQRPESSKKRCFKCASGATFSVALPHRGAVPVLALSVPGCVRCSLCGSCCLDPPSLFVPTSAGHSLILGSPSSIGRAQGP